MKIAFVLDPLDSIKTYKDSSFAMMREAASRGHALAVLQQGDLVLRDGKALGYVRDGIGSANPEPWAWKLSTR